MSSDAGGYGEGWPRGIISGVVLPVRFVKRSSSGPVMLDPSRILRDRHLNRLIVAVGTTSPCQPLTSVTWPSGCGAALPPPRFTTV